MTFVLKSQRLHGPHWLSIKYSIISDEWGDNRGELTGYLHMDKERPTYVTPYKKCYLYYWLDNSRMHVSDNGHCGVIHTTLTGVFHK